MVDHEQQGTGYDPGASGYELQGRQSAPTRPWPDPTPEMLSGDPRFDAVWNCIKGWDINVPDVYQGYMGANGAHVRAILDALAAIEGR